MPKLPNIFYNNDNPPGSSNYTFTPDIVVEPSIVAPPPPPPSSSSSTPSLTGAPATPSFTVAPTAPSLTGAPTAPSLTGAPSTSPSIGSSASGRPTSVPASVSISSLNLYRGGREFSGSGIGDISLNRLIAPTLMRGAPPPAFIDRSELTAELVNRPIPISSPSIFEYADTPSGSAKTTPDGGPVSLDAVMTQTEELTASTGASSEDETARPIWESYVSEEEAKAILQQGDPDKDVTAEQINSIRRGYSELLTRYAGPGVGDGRGVSGMDLKNRISRYTKQRTIGTKEISPSAQRMLDVGAGDLANSLDSKDTRPLAIDSEGTRYEESVLQAINVALTASDKPLLTTGARKTIAAAGTATYLATANTQFLTEGGITPPIRADLDKKSLELDTALSELEVLKQDKELADPFKNVVQMRIDSLKDVKDDLELLSGKPSKQTGPGNISAAVLKSGIEIDAAYAEAFKKEVRRSQSWLDLQERQRSGEFNSDEEYNVAAYDVLDSIAKQDADVRMFRSTNYKGEHTYDWYAITQAGLLGFFIYDSTIGARERAEEELEREERISQRDLQNQLALIQARGDQSVRLKESSAGGPAPTSAAGGLTLGV